MRFWHKPNVEMHLIQWCYDRGLVMCEPEERWYRPKTSPFPAAALSPADTSWLCGGGAERTRHHFACSAPPTQFIPGDKAKETLRTELCKMRRKNKPPSIPLFLRIWFLLRTTPGSYWKSKALMRDLGVKHSRLKYNLDKLLREGRVERGGHGYYRAKAIPLVAS